MAEDLEALPPRERARARARDRKIRGPKVVMDNPGLRKAALERARKVQEERRQRAGGDA